MTNITVTKKELEAAVKDVREVVKEARRRLFELETLQYIREIGEGETVTHESMDSVWSAGKRRGKRS